MFISELPKMLRYHVQGINSIVTKYTPVSIDCMYYTANITKQISVTFLTSEEYGFDLNYDLSNDCVVHIRYYNTSKIYLIGMFYQDNHITEPNKHIFKGVYDIIKILRNLKQDSDVH